MEAAEVHVLNKLGWSLWVSLSLRGAKANLSEGRRVALWFGLARAIAKRTGVYFPRLLWCLRLEQGEFSGREHMHALVGGLPEEFNTIWFCMWVKTWWERHGFARVYLYDPSRTAGEYMLEPEWVEGKRDARLASAYETSKLSSQSVRLLLSKSCYWVVWANDRRACSVAKFRRGACGAVMAPDHPGITLRDVARELTLAE